MDRAEPFMDRFEFNHAPIPFSGNKSLKG